MKKKHKIILAVVLAIIAFAVIVKIRNRPKSKKLVISNETGEVLGEFYSSTLYSDCIEHGYGELYGATTPSECPDVIWYIRKDDLNWAKTYSTDVTFRQS